MIRDGVPLRHRPRIVTGPSGANTPVQSAPPACNTSPPLGICTRTVGSAPSTCWIDMLQSPLVVTSTEVTPPLVVVQSYDAKPLNGTTTGPEEVGLLVVGIWFFALVLKGRVGVEVDVAQSVFTPSFM